MMDVRQAGQAHVAFWGTDEPAIRCQHALRPGEPRGNRLGTAPAGQLRQQRSRVFAALALLMR